MERRPPSSHPPFSAAPERVFGAALNAGEESLRCARSGMHWPACSARLCRLSPATCARQHRQNEGPCHVKGPQGAFCPAAHSAWARQPSKGGDWRPLEDRLSGGADGLPAPRFLCMWIRTHGPRLMSYACVLMLLVLSESFSHAEGGSADYSSNKGHVALYPRTY